MFNLKNAMKKSNIRLLYIDKISIKPDEISVKKIKL